MSIHSGTCTVWKLLFESLYFSCAWLVLFYHGKKSFCTHAGSRTIALPGQWILLMSAKSWTIFRRYDVQNTICLFSSIQMKNQQTKWKTQKPTLNGVFDGFTEEQLTTIWTSEEVWGVNYEQTLAHVALILEIRTQRILLKSTNSGKCCNMEKQFLISGSENPLLQMVYGLSQLCLYLTPCKGGIKVCSYL